ncbi:uncharacterized protein LOC143375506 [Andrena cerasifolii]|uniref:uncharacterized protein LOC143375506 n=1 Tax=Andrena cerasifolii TaxID=2819439 RepID=UPI004037E9CE
MEAGVQFPPKASKSKIFCCVFGCNSKACRNPELSFHHFPKAGKVQINHVNKLGQSEMIDRRKLWEKILKMGKEVTQSMRVCSLHFVKDDYSVFTRPDYPAGARFLKGTAVPTVNLPQSRIRTHKPSGKDVKKRNSTGKVCETYRVKFKKRGNQVQLLSC